MARRESPHGQPRTPAGTIIGANGIKMVGKRAGEVGALLVSTEAQELLEAVSYMIIEGEAPADLFASAETLAPYLVADTAVIVGDFPLARGLELCQELRDRDNGFAPTEALDHFSEKYKDHRFAELAAEWPIEDGAFVEAKTYLQEAIKLAKGRWAASVQKLQQQFQRLPKIEAEYERRVTAERIERFNRIIPRSADIDDSAYLVMVRQALLMRGDDFGAETIALKQYGVGVVYELYLSIARIEAVKEIDRGNVAACAERAGMLVEKMKQKLANGKNLESREAQLVERLMDEGTFSISPAQMPEVAKYARKGQPNQTICSRLLAPSAFRFFVEAKGVASKRPARAIELCQQTLADPDYANYEPVRHLVGKLAFEMSRSVVDRIEQEQRVSRAENEEAVANLRLALEYGGAPRKEVLKYLYGILELLERFEEAAPFGEELVDLEGDRPSAIWNMLATGYLNACERNYDPVRIARGEALSIRYLIVHPNNWEARATLAGFYLIGGKVDQGLDQLDKLLKGGQTAAPRYFSLLGSLGRCPQHAEIRAKQTEIAAVVDRVLDWALPQLDGEVVNARSVGVICLDIMLPLARLGFIDQNLKAIDFLLEAYGEESDLTFVANCAREMVLFHGDREAAMGRLQAMADSDEAGRITIPGARGNSDQTVRERIQQYLSAA